MAMKHRLSYLPHPTIARFVLGLCLLTTTLLTALFHLAKRSHKRVVERGFYLLHIHVHADDDQQRAPIAIMWVPILNNLMN